MASASPCFRRDLAAVTVAEGEIELVEVSDPAGQTVFRLYAFEHAIAEQLDGRPWATLVASVREAVGLDLSEQQLEQFAKRLGELGLLETSAARVADPDPDPDRTAPGGPAGDKAAAADPSRADATGDGLAGDGEPTAVVRDLAALLASVDAAGRSASPAPAVPLDSSDATPAVAHVVTHVDAGAAAAVTDAPAAAPADAAARDGSPNESAPRPFDDTPLVELAPAALAASAVTEAPPPRASASDVGLTSSSSDVAPMQGSGQPSEVPGVADQSAALPVPSPSPRSSVPRGLVWLAAALATAGAAYGVWRLATGGSRPVSVHTVVPAPAQVHRWFDTAGTIRGIGAIELTAAPGGRVAEVKPAGSRFEPGDVLVLFEGGKRVVAELRHAQERLAFYEQRLEEMRAKNDRPEARQAQLKIGEKQRLATAARAELARVALLATNAGEVVAPLVAAGDEVAPGTPVVRIKGQRLQAVFELSADDAKRARELPFCRVELEDHGELDCEMTTDGGDDAPISVAFTTQLPVHAGQRVRLARARFEGVFTVPASAVVQVGRSERIFVAAPTGRAEVRAVAVADRSPTDAIVTQGIDVGDAVIVDVPSTLRPNARVSLRTPPARR